MRETNTSIFVFLIGKVIFANQLFLNNSFTVVLQEQLIHGSVADLDVRQISKQLAI